LPQNIVHEAILSYSVDDRASEAGRLPISLGQ
jgi:hypothetical protein